MDKDYIDTMARYKELRRSTNKSDRLKAKQLLQEAQTMSRSGKVSEKAILAAAYL